MREFTLDGNSASGALKITAGAKPDFTGTLAFDTLDLTPYFAGLPRRCRSGRTGGACRCRPIGSPT